MPKRTSGGDLRSSAVWTLALHGGAGAPPEADHAAAEAHISDLLRRGAKLLSDGASAIEVVNQMVRGLEESGFHIAGRGASPNTEGRYQLDAAIMDGETRRAGAVAAIEGVRSPVDAARAVLDHTPHVLLAGEGAAQFARSRGLAAIEAGWFKPVRDRTYERAGAGGHGTVGAVALDSDGALAAATSTGGTFDKLPGRVGDTPIVGAGTWADERVAVSCTGLGEFFVRANAAADVSARIRYARADLDEACRAVLDDVRFLGGEGGMIAVDCLGRASLRFNTPAMKRGLADSSGAFMVATRP